MPALSPRARLLRLLRLLIPLWLATPTLSAHVPLLFYVRGYIQSTRYLADRSTSVPKTGSWEPKFLLRVGEVRVRRLVRMDLATFQALQNLLADHPNFHNVPKKEKKLPIQLHLEIFLMFISTSGVGGSYFKISDHFGVGEGTVRTVVGRVVSALLELFPRVIRWPTEEEKALTKAFTNSRSGFAACIGFIDGTAFNLLECPSMIRNGCRQGDAYFNRKSRYAIAGTVVCDFRRRFTGFYVGETGCAHDARQLHQMEIYKRPSAFFCGDEYVIGDAGYPLREFLITPFKKPQADDVIHRHYNTMLSKVRIRVEQSLGLLKERFPRLKDGFATVIGTADDHKFVCDCISAAAVLHNFCIDVRDGETQNLLEVVRATDGSIYSEHPSGYDRYDDRVQYERALRKREEIEEAVIDKYLRST